MLVAFAIALTALATTTPPRAVAAGASAGGTGLVGRSGVRLTLDGRPWRFVGFNDYRLTSDPDDGGYTCGGAMSDADVDAVMARTAAAGGSVVRTWWFETFAGPATGDARFAAFDRVLAAAGRHGLKVVAVLANQQADCEQRPGPLTLADYQPGSAFETGLESWATTLAARYRGDPRIAYWELVNEPEAPGPTCDEVAATRALTGFAGTVATALEAVDPGHLVDMGTLGTGQCGTVGADYAPLSSAPGSGICEYHDYGDPAVAMPDDGFNRLAQRIAQCARLHEPVVVGEAGIDAPTPCGAPGLQARADEFRAKMEAAFSRGVSGYLVWEAATAPTCAAGADDQGHDYAVGPGDPLDGVLRLVAASLGPSTHAGPRSGAAVTPRAPARRWPAAPTGAGVAAAVVLLAATVRLRRTRRRAG